MRRAVKILGAALLALVVAGMTAWAAAALRWSDLPSARLRDGAAALFVLATLLAFALLPRRGRTLFGFAAVFALLVAWWLRIPASHDRAWQEEVSVTPLAEGIDFGWPITEGLHCFRPSSGCDTAGLTLPVLEVSHGDAGTCSITGGIVYRGGSIPELQGHYFYSDFCGGYLRSFRYDGVAAVDHTDWTEQVGIPGAVPGFGLDGAGEMYVLTTEELLAVVPERR